MAIKSSSSKKTVKSKKKNDDENSSNLDYMGLCLLLLVIFISVFTLPSDSLSPVRIELIHVWYFGWITAVSTGLGALPFFFVKEPSKYWIGLSNATAGGMMIAASYQLAIEGIFDLDSEQNTIVNYGYGYNTPPVRTVIGFIVGVIFIYSTKIIMENFGGEEAKVDLVSSPTINGSNDSDNDNDSISKNRKNRKNSNNGNSNNSNNNENTKIDVNKIILIIFVMTLHSMSEGIGIGVSFGGGQNLGTFISLSLAIHNIPEGLAVALILTTRKFSTLRASLWAIFTSLPQPLMALPAYLFVDSFRTVLPIGLGFAAGAMAYVAFFELIVDAVAEVGKTMTYTTVVGALVIMTLAQEMIRFCSTGGDEL